MYFMVHTFLQYIEVLGAVMGKYSIVLCTTLIIVQIYYRFTTHSRYLHSVGRILQYFRKVHISIYCMDFVMYSQENWQALRTVYCTVHCTVLNIVLYCTLYCTVHCTVLYIVLY